MVLYKLSPMTYALGKPLAKVDMYAMVNLIAGRRVVVELIQDACTAEAVAGELAEEGSFNEDLRPHHGQFRPG